MRHPPLERLGFGLAGTQDEGIQARFGNNCHFLLSTGGVHTMDALFILIQKCKA